MVMDPYLANGDADALCKYPLSKNVRFLPFVPDLVDLVHHSDLLICRAGYNTVNEILLTGAKAIIIPESHGGGEQELRAKASMRKTFAFQPRKRFSPTMQRISYLTSSIAPHWTSLQIRRICGREVHLG